MGAGYIYILSNSAMPGLIKIGLTYRRVEERLLELSGVTGVPTPFVIEYFCLTADVEEVEKELHARFSTTRSPGREFFATALPDAIRAADSLMRPLKPHRFCRVEPQSDTERKGGFICDDCGELLWGRKFVCPKCGNADPGRYRFAS